MNLIFIYVFMNLYTYVYISKYTLPCKHIYPHTYIRAHRIRTAEQSRLSLIGLNRVWVLDWGCRPLRSWSGV